MSNNTQSISSYVDTILWKPKRKFYFLAILQYAIYFGMAIFFCWFCWFVLLKESLWYFILALGLSIFFAFESYKALNFQSMLLTEKGLLVKTRFNGEIFYPYGKFVMSYSIAVGLRFFERITIHNPNNKKEFLFPCGYDSLGNFENNQAFKELCTTYTQQALESMDTEKIVELYILYANNIEYIFNEERSNNVFTIDFSPHQELLKEYFCKEIQNTFNSLSANKQLSFYRGYEQGCNNRKLYNTKKDLRFDMDYLAPYKDRIESLKDKNE